MVWSKNGIWFDKSLRQITCSKILQSNLQRWYIGLNMLVLVDNAWRCRRGSRILKWGVKFLHLNQRNQISFQYLRDKKKKKKRKKGAQKKGGVKIHPFHLPWIRACDVIHSSGWLSPVLPLPGHKYPSFLRNVYPEFIASLFRHLWSIGGGSVFVLENAVEKALCWEI